MAGRGRIAEFHHAPPVTVARLFNFDISQDWLKPEHKTWLSQNVVDRLRRGGSLWIMGLTSTTGAESFNHPLSQKRAKSVVTFLQTALSKDFPVKVEVQLGMGEIPARIAGLRDNTEDANWRAVLLSVWDKRTPPPPPPPPPVQEECRRIVIRASGGVSIYAFLEDRAGGRTIIEQVTRVKASPDYITKCATDFERKWSFLSGRSSTYPIVLEYASDPGSDIVGEVVGHLFKRVNRYYIVMEEAAFKRLPAPYNEPNNVNTLSIDGLLQGYQYGGPHGDDFVSLGGKVPLFLSYGQMAGYVNLGYSSEGAESYDVATDMYGQILARIGTYPSRYPRTESTLSVVVKAGVKKLARKAIGALLFP
jgi:hypothetical protein